MDEYEVLKISIERLEEVDSTNSELKRRIMGLRLTNPIVLAAQRQTRGRGRRGKVWLNLDGAALMSVAVPLKGLEPDNYPLVSYAAALAVCDAVAAYGVDPCVKWPNDVLIDDAKICGILSELVLDKDSMPCAVIGIGINANSECIPEELGSNAASLKLKLGLDVDIDELIENTAGGVVKYVKTLSDRTRLLKTYRAKCSTLGREITVIQNNDEKWRGSALDIAEDGRLIVRTETGEIRLIDAADVSVRK